MRANRVQSQLSKSSMATSPTNSPLKASRWNRTITRCRERRYSCGVVWLLHVFKFNPRGEGGGMGGGYLGVGSSGEGPAW